MTRIAVHGAKGRMGQRILALAEESKQFEIAGRFDSGDAPALFGNGVLIDFSSPEGSRIALEACIKAKWGLVVGTTGLDAQAANTLEDAAQQIPIVFSSNMSVGVNLVAQLLEHASKKLPDFKIKMTEAHHVHKKDAPSGTALMLQRVIAYAKGWDKTRAAKEIPIDVKREGEIVGDHTVLFTGPAETIEITHRAQSRDTFARGALQAARFAAEAKPGRLYSMADVLA